VGKIDDAVQLQKTIRKLEQEKERAKGRAEQLLKTLETDFDCESLEDAERLLAQKEKKQQRLAKKYETEHAAFISKWGEKLR